MFDLKKIDDVLTMSSLEMVKLINSTRKEGGAELTHSDFLKKVPLVLGEKDAGKFSSIYKDSMNRSKPCYNFPKREACLMAMSYSYELQAAIFDRWQELENKFTNERLNKLERQQARLEGKVARRVETDTIKKFVEYATKQGSSNAKFYYSLLTKGTYKALFILEKGANVKDMRERLNVLQLQQLAVAENLLQEKIAGFMRMNIPYKDIYKLSLAELDRLVAVLGKQLPGEDNIFKISK